MPPRRKFPSSPKLSGTSTGATDASLPVPAAPIPSMTDVAAAAGVSRATVSLVLRNSQEIRPETRARVREVARRLGYKPNPMVSALMALRSRRRKVGPHTVLAFAVSHRDEDLWRNYPSYVQLHEGAQQRALELGYRLENFHLRSAGMTSARMREIFVARNIPGVLVCPLPHTDLGQFQFDISGLPVVGLGFTIGSPVMERVAADYFRNAMQGFVRCRSLGYRRIGFVLSREISAIHEHHWFAACALFQRNLPRAERVAPLMPDWSTEITAAVPAWLERTRPDVVVYATELDSTRLPQIPLEVGLVNLEVRSAQSPISGMYLDYRRLGAIGVEHLIARVQRNDVGPVPEPCVQLLAASWSAGRTLPGPGRMREPITHLV